MPQCASGIATCMIELPRNDQVQYEIASLHDLIVKSRSSQNQIWCDIQHAKNKTRTVQKQIHESETTLENLNDQRHQWDLKRARFDDFSLLNKISEYEGAIANEEAVFRKKYKELLNRLEVLQNQPIPRIKFPNIVPVDLKTLNSKMENIRKEVKKMNVSKITIQHHELNQRSQELNASYNEKNEKLNHNTTKMDVLGQELENLKSNLDNSKRSLNFQMSKLHESKELYHEKLCFLHGNVTDLTTIIAKTDTSIKTHDDSWKKYNSLRSELADMKRLLGIQKLSKQEIPKSDVEIEVKTSKIGGTILPFRKFHPESDANRIAAVLSDKSRLAEELVAIFSSRTLEQRIDTVKWLNLALSIDLNHVISQSYISPLRNLFQNLITDHSNLCASSVKTSLEDRNWNRLALTELIYLNFINGKL